MNNFTEHCFSDKQKYPAVKILAIATSFMGLIASGCSEQTATVA